MVSFLVIPVVPAGTHLLTVAFPIISEYFGLWWSEAWEFLKHYPIAILAFVLSWAATWPRLAKKWENRPQWDPLRRRLREALLIILILAILALSRLTTNHAIWARTAQESRVRANRAYTYTYAQLGGIDKPSPSDQLVILSLGIGQITTRTFDLIRNSHPEFELRAISVHLELNNGSVEDVIQEGELKKDRTVFPPGTSFVGATIQEYKNTHKYKYCRDLSKRKEDPECKTFADSGSDPPYASLLCYPFALGHDEAFGAVCLDSARPHAFDDAVGIKGRPDKAYDDIRDQLAQLATLLHAFRDVRLSLQSGLEKSKRNPNQIMTR
jgi:hypothetical protein